MKNITLISLLITLLTACSTPTPSLTATATTSRTALSSVTFTATDTPLPTLTPTPPPVEFNTLAPETMGCLKNDMCLGLEVKDKESAYQAVVEAFYGEYENREWMQQMKIGSLEQFQAFLRTSTHTDPATGEERTHWIPLTAPGGATFKILQGNGTASGGATFSDKNPAIVEQGGFWLDTIGFVAASKKEIDANTGGVADWLKEMWDQNGKSILLQSDNSVPAELWGIAFVNGKLCFVTLNNASEGSIPENFPDKDKLLSSTNIPKMNAKIASAELQLYLEACIEYKNYPGTRDISNKGVEPDSTLWEVAPSLYIAGKYAQGNIYDAPSWFVASNTDSQ